MRAILTVLLLIIQVVTAQAWPLRGNGSVSNNGGIVLNLAIDAYYSGPHKFLNFWRTGSILTLVSSTKGTLVGQQIWDDGSYLDANGELKSPMPADVVSIERLFFTPIDYAQYQYAGTSFNNFANQQFDVAWTGCATPTLGAGGALGTGGSVVGGSNTGTITLGSSGYGNVSMKMTFTGQPSCYTSPPRNISIIQHQYAAAFAAGEIFNPDWLSDIKPGTGFVRLMDWMTTNFSTITESSQLADENYSTYIPPLVNAVGAGSINSNVLTLSSFFHGTPFAVGQRIVCPGCAAGLTITSLGTGTGGAGTYNLSPSATNVSGKVMTGILPVGANGSRGPKGGIAPSLVCKLINKLQSNVEYPIPIAASDQFVIDVATAFKGCVRQGLLVKYSYGNENWNEGFDTYSYVIANPISNYSGYRAAQIMELIRGVYGTNSYDAEYYPNSRWVGAIGAQAANPSVASSFISGALAYLAVGPSPYKLWDLFSQVDIAPYWGAFFNGVCISGITAAATPTVSVNTGCGNATFTNGQTVRMFVSGGTMAAVLNNVDVTVSNWTGSSFQINVSTAGLTYGGSPNGAMDSTIFKLADQSTALNASTPATYPTKFAYFNQQMSKAILNGSASDPSYGTLTVGSGLNLSTAPNSLLDYFQQNALIANSNGLDLGQYEGGPTQTLVAAGQNFRPSQAVEFLNMSLYDAGVTGDTTNTSANLYTTAYSQFDSVYGKYASQFDDTSAISQYGPWGALRFFPGDTANVKWTKVVARNAQGPKFNPSPLPTWTVTNDGSNFGSGGSTTLSCSYTASANGLAVAAFSWTNTAAVSSVTLDGVAMTQNSLSQVPSAWSAAIYSAPVTAGAHTITITWATTAPFRNCYALTLSGLLSTTPFSVSTGNPSRSTAVAVTRGAFVLAVAAIPNAAAPTFDSSSSKSGRVSGNVTQIDNSATKASGLAYWSPGPTYDTSIFTVATSQGNALAVAVFK